jgi:hypothetical protein
MQIRKFYSRAKELAAKLEEQLAIRVLCWFVK